MPVARVAALTYYPVKGLSGVSADRAEVGPTGLRNDRNFMLVEPDGTFLSQGSLPAMASLRAEIDGDSLRLSGPGAPNLEIPIQYDGKRRDVSLFDRWFGRGIVQDPAAFQQATRTQPGRTPAASVPRAAGYDAAAASVGVRGLTGVRAAGGACRGLEPRR